MKVQTLKAKYKSATLDEFVEQYSADITRVGMFIKTPKPPPTGTHLRVEVMLKDGSPVFTAVGRVAWVREQPEGANPAGMGIRFTRVEEDPFSTIERIVARRAPGTGPRFDDEETSAEPAGETQSAFFGTTNPAAEMPPPSDRTVLRQMNAFLDEALRSSSAAPEGPATAFQPPPPPAAAAAPSARARLGQQTVMGLAPPVVPLPTSPRAPPPPQDPRDLDAAMKALEDATVSVVPAVRSTAPAVASSVPMPPRSVPTPPAADAISSAIETVKIEKSLRPPAPVADRTPAGAAGVAALAGAAGMEPANSDFGAMEPEVARPSTVTPAAETGSRLDLASLFDSSGENSDPGRPLPPSVTALATNMGAATPALAEDPGSLSPPEGITPATKSNPLEYGATLKGPFKQSRAPAPTRFPRVALAAGIVVVLAAAGVAAWQFMGPAPAPPPAPPSVPAQPAAVEPPPPPPPAAPVAAPAPAPAPPVVDAASPEADALAPPVDGAVATPEAAAPAAPAPVAAPAPAPAPRATEAARAPRASEPPAEALPRRPVRDRPATRPAPAAPRPSSSAAVPENPF